MALRRNFLRLIASLLMFAAPMAASAITIHQVITPPSAYEYEAGRGHVGLLLSLSTADNWRTADLQLTVRSHPNLRSSDVYMGIGGSAASGALAFSNVRAAWDIAAQFAAEGYVGLYGPNNTSIGFTLSSIDPNYTVWDALAAGISIDHGFFANEYFNGARISLTYPSITSYTIQLGEAALVPVPAAAALTLTGIGVLGLVSRKRKKSGTSPAKTTGVPAEA